MTGILKCFSGWHNRRQFFIAAVRMSMHEKSSAVIPRIAIVLGSACAGLSLLLAAFMWHRAGNPAVVLVWLTSCVAVLAYARLHRRQLAAFERMASQRAAVPLWRASEQWDGMAEDVAFTDLPRSACISSLQGDLPLNTLAACK